MKGEVKDRPPAGSTIKVNFGNVNGAALWWTGEVLEYHGQFGQKAGPHTPVPHCCPHCTSHCCRHYRCLTLVRFSARPEHFFWDGLGGLISDTTVTRQDGWFQ